MDAIGFGLLGAIIGIVWFALGWRRGRKPLMITQHRVRCPISDDVASISVATDTTARSRDQYIAVESCSLLSQTAIGLPERVTYLSDAPACKVRLTGARPAAVYTSEIGCWQDCVFMLNASATPGAPLPVLATCNAGNAVQLAGQSCGNARIARLLWSAGV